MPPPLQTHPGVHWRLIIWDTNPRLSQQEVAHRAHISEKHLSRILNGHDLPGITTVTRFAHALEQDAAALWSEVAAYRLQQMDGEASVDG